LSGNEAEQFASSFSSDLLWYRLFPNPTYPTGILLAILIVSLPLFLLVADRLLTDRMAFHPVRLLGLGAMLLVLFVGGLVVSVKIGGGSNLHNLDAFLALLLVIAAFIFFGRFEKDVGAGLVPAPEPDPAEPRSAHPRFWIQIRPNYVRHPAMAAALLIGVYYSLIVGGQFLSIDQEATGKALSIVNRFVRSAVEEGGEVLFISERQLLTFHDVEKVPLIQDYERVFLMEMAMSGNPDYLGRFHEELKNHRFALIVSEPLFVQYKGSAESFGEENDAWVNQVSKVVMCYYEPQRLLRDVRIQLLVPREKPRDCQ
jgi:hypothetical protein